MKNTRRIDRAAGANRRASFETTKQFYHSAAAPATREALNHLIVEPDQVVELRILNTSKGTVSGYFTDLDKLAEAASRWSGKAPAVYITVNPVLPDLLARACNWVKHYVKATTTDDEILCRVWLLIDFDAKRPANISSTNAEHDAALARAQQCREWLRSQGWPDPNLCRFRQRRASGLPH